MSIRASSGSGVNSKAQLAALVNQGQLEQAWELLGCIVAESPNDIEALLLRAKLAIRLRRWGAARADLETLVRMQPANEEGVVLLGLAQKNEGCLAESVTTLKRAITMNPSNAFAHNTLGMCYLEMREPDRAIEALQKAVKLEPRSGATYHNLASALRLSGQGQAALDAFRRTVELSPEVPSAFLSLSQQLRLMGLKQECVKVLETGRNRHPRYLPLLLVLAQAYGDTNRASEAEALYRHCQAVDPSAVQAFAIWLQKEGRFEESIEVLRDSVELAPNQGLGYASLADARIFTLKDGSCWADRIPSLLDDPHMIKMSKMHLWYALARAKEKDRDCEGAMLAWDAANELAFATYNAGRPYDVRVSARVTDQTIALYGSGELGRISSKGSLSDKPIFIVGMIRSGTTLLDQILSRHSMVRSAGESEFWTAESQRLNSRWSNGVKEEDLEDLAVRYLRELELEAGDAPFITDKMPLNFQHLGPIRATFPNAKILHIRRNALDTCLSIYATHFGNGPHFAYKKKNIIFYYQEYLRLMEHWRRVLPVGAFYELDYEELVSDQGKVIRGVLGFCGVPWETSCLHPEGNAGRIATPSRWQARQPIYNTSAGKWKAYEAWLGEFDVLKTLKHPPPRT